MKKLTFFLALLISGLGNAQNSFGTLPSLNYQIDSSHIGHAHCGWSKDVHDICKATQLKNTSIYPSTSQFTCGKFKVYYADLLPGAPAVGFADPSFGTERRNTFCAVLTYVQSVFDFSNVPSNNPIRIEVEASFAPVVNPAPSTVGYFAYAGPTLNYSTANKIEGGNVFDYIMTGNNNVPPNGFHAIMKVNFDQTFYNGYAQGGINWLNDYTQNISNCKIDLFSVLLHEVGHTLGFLSLANDNGQLAPQSLSGQYNFSRLDFLLHKSNSLTATGLQKFILGSLNNANMNSVFINTPINDNKFWSSGNVAPNNIPIYSGGYLSDQGLMGSYLSHIDDQRFSFAFRSRNSPGFEDDYVMGPFGFNGLTRRSFTDAEIKIFLEMGYALNINYSNSNLFNLPPYSLKIGNDLDYNQVNQNSFPNVFYVESVVADAQIVNNVGNTYIYNLWEDNGIMDPEGQTLTIADGSLTNIRGCGNGGNNHAQLQLSPDKRTITFTPRANFIGRAQFAFKLFDGAKIGSWHLVTIDVTTGNNVIFPFGSNQLINGNCEEGSEVRRTTLGDNTKPYTSLDKNYRPGFLHGVHYSDANPYNNLGNYWTTYGGGDFIRNSFNYCNPDNFGSEGNSIHNQNWGFIFPLPNNNQGDRYRRTMNGTWYGLGKPLEKCHKYILKLDYIKAPDWSFMPDVNNLTFGFCNIINNNPIYQSPILNSLSAPITPTLNSWIHIEIPFNYCSQIPTSFLYFNANAKLLIDNIEIIEVPNDNLLQVLINSSNTICNGETTLISTTLSNVFCDATYLWSNGATTSSISVSPSSTQTYTVTVNDGCQTVTASQTINVNSSPNATITVTENSGTANDGTICNGTSATLTASGGTPVWSTGQTTSSITVSPIATTTYTVTVTSNGCSASASQTITANPNVTPTFTQVQPICSGSTLNALPTTSVNGITGTWSPALNNTATTTYTFTPDAGQCANSTSLTILVTSTIATTPSFNPVASICQGATLNALPTTSTNGITGTWSPALNNTASTTYTFTPNPGQCATTTTMTITVNSLPTAAISVTESSGTANDGTICNGTSATLTASGGTPGWSTGQTTTSIIVSPNVTTTYSVTVTSNGCSASATQTITVNPLPTAAISVTESSGTANDGTICNGTSATLTASGGTPVWSTGQSTTSITVSPSTTTTYTVTVTSNGCSASASQTITVNPLPTAAISVTENSGTANDGTICNGTSATLNASGGTPVWSTGQTTSSITVSPSTTTTYTVTVTSNGCSASASQTITVNPNVTPTFTQVPPICSGATLNPLPSNSTNNPSITGTWWPALNNTTTTTYTFTPNTVQCATTTTMTITVNPLPTAAISVTENSGIASNDGVVCSGASVTLNASGGGDYVWSNSAGTNSSITFTATSNLTRTVTVTLNGCTVTASQTITVNPLPATFTIAATETSGTTYNDGTICIGASVTLTASGTIAPTWSTGVTAQSITVSPTTTTTYTATITNAAGCQRTSSRLITVRPLPVFSVTNNNPVICSGSSSLLTVSPSTGLSNFTWSPGTSTTSSMSVSPTTTTTYSVSARNTTTGCWNTATTTVTVNSVSTTICCTTAQYTYNSPFNAIAFPNNSIIQVNANMTINQNRTFNGCTFRLGPNVKIIVNSGVTLTLTNCKLFSCSQMWDGIYVGSGSQVVVSNSRIEDALNAINSTGNGNYIVTNTVFNKNNIGIKVSDFTTHLGEVSGSTFDCTSTGSLDQSTSTTLKIPMNGEKSHFGIHVIGGGGITIGKPSAAFNLFQNIETGIYVDNSLGYLFPQPSGPLKIYRNQFEKIYEPYCFAPNVCDPNGHVGRPIWTNYTRTYIGDNLGVNYENKFKDCSNGVSLINPRLFYVTKNDFNNITSGGLFDNLINSKSIYVYGSLSGATDNNGEISNNRFSKIEYGIVYLENAQRNLLISNNELNDFNTLDDKTAIYLLNSQTQNVQIQNNIINKPILNKGINGIRIQNASVNQGTGNIVIQKNSIKNTKNAIWVTNQNNVEIRDQHSDFFADNVMTTKAGIYFDPNVPSSTTVGIRIEGANNTLVKHNLIQRMDYSTGGISTFPELGMVDATRMYGIYVGENCINSNIIDNTTLKMGTGIYVFGNNNLPTTFKCNFMKFHPIGFHINGIIGQQGTATAPQDNQWAIVTPGSLGIKREGSQPPTFYTRSLSMPFLPSPNTQFQPISTAITVIPSTGTMLYSCQEGCANPPCALPAGLIQIITSTGEYGVLSEEELKVLDIEIYKSLKISPYDYDVASEDGLKYQEFMDSMDMTNAYKIYDLEKELALKDTVAAQQKLVAFEAFGDVELNYKKVFEVYVNNWMKGKYYLAKQDSIKLKEIAFQSPRVAGNAVYMARVMLSIDTIDTETYSAKSMHHSNTVVFDQLKLYPNPASEYIHYQLPVAENETGWVKIIDLSGKIVKEWKVNGQNTIGSFDVCHYSKGIYMFELELMNGKSIVKKLVVE